MSLYFLSVSKYLLTMRNVSLNTKKYKLPSNIDVPTTTPYPYKYVKRNVAGWNHNRASLFRRIPDQSAHSKALLSVPETRVEEKIVTDYTKQAKAAEKTKLDGIKMNEGIIFDTLEKLKSKKKPTGKKKKKTPKKAQKKTTKKFKKPAEPNFSISS